MSCIKSRILICLISLLFFSACNDLRMKEEERNFEQKSTSTKVSCDAPSSSEDSSKFISHTIRVVGQIENELNLNVDSLKKMDVKTIKDYKVICGTGEVKKNFETCKGVLLKEIIKHAGIKILPDGNRNFNVIVTATDGYKACFTWAELNNSETGNNAYIIFEQNSEAIKNTGDMNLICTSDFKTAMRHVIWVKQIEVKAIN